MFVKRIFLGAMYITVISKDILAAMYLILLPVRECVLDIQDRNMFELRCMRSDINKFYNRYTE